MNYPNIDFVGIVHDPIWGEIPITYVEEKLLKTEAFSRLRNIKQMSMAYIGYIGAQHTRYEHSIGVMHVAYQLLIGLNPLPNNSQILEQLNSRGIRIDERVIKYIRIAALLHDIGHAPLSHLVETAIERYPQIIDTCIENLQSQNRIEQEFSQFDLMALMDYSHESFSMRRILCDTEIIEILKEDDINPEYVAYLVAGYEKVKEVIPAKYKVFRQLISGDLDADRLDYINRDFYFCGMKQVIDLGQFSKALSIGFENGKSYGDGNPTILIDESAILQASSFLFSRLMLEQSIHYDMKSKYIELAFIDLVRDFLLSMDGTTRLQYIINLHSILYDAEFIKDIMNFNEYNLPSAKEYAKHHNMKTRLTCSSRSLFTGSIGDDIITSVKLTNEHLHPNWRYYSKYFIQNQSLITELERCLGNEIFKDIDFNLDIFSSKSSQMLLPVYNSGRVKNLSDDFIVTLPHSLMITAMQSTKVCLYTKKGFNIDELVFNDKITNNIKEMVENENEYAFKSLNESDIPNRVKLYGSLCYYMQEIVVQDLIKKGTIPEEIVILIIMDAIKSHIRENFNHTTAVWIKKDTVLHGYISSHFGKYFSKDSKNYTENSNYSSKLYRLTEQLVCWGFIDHIHKPISFPNSIMFTARTDRSINQWGESFIKFLRSRLSSDVFDAIKNKVYETQNNVMKELTEIRKYEMGKETSEILFKTEEKIKEKQGCLIKFI